MKSKDVTQKMLESYNDVFADIVNVLLFNGKRVIKENTLFQAGIESTLKFDGKISSQDRDVAKYWNKSKINLAMFGFENQTAQDRLMPMRVF
ncbi:MAG: transposase, partial [Lachnospiraceae bacterium oral taxon 082]|nr:transposase [Lachnospiraceae bacterium oral taxon 082]